MESEDVWEGFARWGHSSCRQIARRGSLFVNSFVKQTCLVKLHGYSLSTVLISGGLKTNEIVPAHKRLLEL